MNRVGCRKKSNVCIVRMILTIIFTEDVFSNLQEKASVAGDQGFVHLDRFVNCCSCFPMQVEIFLFSVIHIYLDVYVNFHTTFDQQSLCKMQAWQPSE